MKSEGTGEFRELSGGEGMFGSGEGLRDTSGPALVWNSAHFALPAMPDSALASAARTVGQADKT
eukprot:5479029-Amphidinium_carterae.1